MEYTGESDWTVYCDESGTTDVAPCYSIGALALRTCALAQFGRWFDAVRERWRLDQEAKWTNINRGYGLANLALEAFYQILRSPNARLYLMVVKKSLYRRWREGEEVAFRHTYTYLVQHVARNTAGRHDVVLDHRSTSYPLWHEVVGKIGNNLLRRQGGSGILSSIQPADSRYSPPLQAIDLITGAVNTAHCIFEKREMPVNAGKRMVIERMAEVIRWDGLHYDTYPNEVYNVWHFPCDGFRGVPASREVPSGVLKPRYVTRVDFSTRC